MTTYRVRILGFALAGALGLGGCGNLTAGGFGEAEVEVVGDEADSGAQSSAQATYGGEGILTGGNPFQGYVTVGMRVYLEPEGEGDGLLIFRGVQDVVVDVRGETPVRVGGVTIPPGRYRGARVVFTRITADINHGSLGEEFPLTGLVTVELDEELEVRDERTFLVNDRQRVVVRVDLRSSAWLQHATPALRVAPERFLDAVRVTVRQEFGPAL